MKSTFDYKFEKTGTAELVVNDLGNCSIQANMDGWWQGAKVTFSYFLIVRTLMGKMTVFEYGPTIIDSDYTDSLPGDSCFCSYHEEDFSEYRLQKIIDNFLNNPKRNISSAKLINASEALSYCKSIVDYMKKTTIDIPQGEDMLDDMNDEDDNN